MTAFSRIRWSSASRICTLVPSGPGLSRPFQHFRQSTRRFHEYFVTHLPSSSLSPDSRGVVIARPGHKLPRDASVPHRPSPGSSPPAASPPDLPDRDLTTVRIPMRRAKHHLGVATARGNRPYNEDTVQVGTVDMPAFARRAPVSYVIKQRPGEAVPVEGVFGDPQIFYFGVFDGHGGSQCSEFLRDELHGYVEEACSEFGLQSTLRRSDARRPRGSVAFPRPDPASPRIPAENPPGGADPDDLRAGALSKTEDEMAVPPKPYWAIQPEGSDQMVRDENRAHELKRDLVAEYANVVGGYFRKFDPEYFDLSEEEEEEEEGGGGGGATGLESVLMYAFLRADLDFVRAQARKPDPDDPILDEIPLNDDEVLGAPHAPPSGHRIGGRTRFNGGSTASVALISTPTPAPYWHPSASATLVVAHVGDSRILACETGTGLARPLTSDHHPSTPVELRRLARRAPQGGSSMICGDSFGEERIAGLANSRAFGDMRGKRVGVSAEPEITRIDMGPAQYSFLVLMSDGVSGSVSDQEIVDVIKEARTPEEGARKVVEYATDVSREGDNATCLVVRLGGWERRSEGGLGSLSTKEMRDMRLAEALDPRKRKR